MPPCTGRLAKMRTEAPFQFSPDPVSRTPPRMKKSLCRTGPLAAVLLGLVLIGLMGAAPVSAQPQEWQPADGPLLTRWADDIVPSNPLPEYPRPKMRRENWTNLNGLWDFQISKKRSKGEYEDQILVPYPVESALSGVTESVGAANRVWYRRTVLVDPVGDERVLLHTGASDWETQVFVNGQHVGQHQGGYDPLTVDITDALKDEGPQTIEVHRVGSDRSGTSAAWQADPRSPRHLVHGRDGHLADGVAGAGAGDVHQRSQGDPAGGAEPGKD